AILQVMTIVFFGYLLTKKGYFDMEKQKWLSKLNLVFFTPCLLFSNVASVISMQKLIEFWPIPVFYCIFMMMSFIGSQTVSRMIRLSSKNRRFVLACALFPNTNSLPIAIISSLAVSEAAEILFSSKDDTPEAVASRGISYTLFFALFGNLVRWSYGYHLLKRRDGDDDDKDQYTVTHASESTYSHHYTTPHQGYNSDENTSLLGSNSHYKSTVEHITDRVPSSWWFVCITKKIDGFMSPPLYAATLALFVGLTPLKQLMYGEDSFLYPSFTKAIEVCGKAAVPLVLSCLGAQLTCISESHHEVSPGVKKPVSAAIFVRMLLMPFLGIPFVVLFVIYGSQWSVLAQDPVFIVMMIVLSSTPTAINLVQITQVNGIFEEEMLRMLFWSYGIICIPVCTILVFVALNIVDKLL
ncbi:auxin efflux carrier, partial [Spinellus fusiger]